MALITNLKSTSTAIITDKYGVSYEIAASGSVTIANNRLLATSFAQGVANGWISVSGWSDPNGNLGGLVTLTNVSYPRGIFSNLALGENDLYTAPAGRRALIMSVGGYNTAGGSNTITVQVKKSSTYYPLSTATALSTLSSSPNLILTPYILEPGESLSVLTTLAGTNVSVIITEYDSTAPLFSKSKSTFSVGYNTLYTCPTSRYASIGFQHFNRTLQSGGAGVSPTAAYINATGAGANVVLHLVPNSVTPSSATQFTPTTATATATGYALVTAGSMLNAGDFVSLNTDVTTAGQYAWVNIWEMGT